MTEKEKQAKEFLEWISIEKNAREMKKALAKNITYNQDIFDDIFQDSIVKVYNSIMNGNEVKDFKSYMFITLKFNYINKDNQIKNRQKVEVRFEPNDNMDFIDESDLEEEEFKDRLTTDSIKTLEQILLENFTEKDVYLFTQYFKLKVVKYNLGYKELSAMTGTNIRYIANLISRMRKWISENEEIREIKNKLQEYGIC